MRDLPKPTSTTVPAIIEVEPVGGHPVPPKEGLVVKPMRGSYLPYAIQYTRKVPCRKPWNIMSTLSGKFEVRIKERLIVYPSLEVWLRLDSTVEQYVAYKIKGKEYGSLVYD